MKGHSLIGAKILGNSKSSSQARHWKIRTDIFQLPDLYDLANQPQPRMLKVCLYGWGGGIGFLLQ
jgi:hypothetical protein